MYRCRLRWLRNGSWSQLLARQGSALRSGRHSSSSGTVLGAATERKDPHRDNAQPFSFQGVDTENELRDVLTHLGERLTGKRVAAAFRRLIQFECIPQKETLTFMTDMALQHASSMSVDDAISLLTCCCRLPSQLAFVSEAMMWRIVERECLLQLNGVLIAKCLTSLADLQQFQQPPSSTFDPADETIISFKLLEELGRLFVASGFAANLSTSHLVQIVSGFGKLRFQNPTVQQVICEEVSNSSRLESMRYDELVSVWRALVSLQVAHRRALVAVSDEIILPERLLGFKATELVSLLAASKQLPFRQWQFLFKLIAEMTKDERLSIYTEAHIVHIIHALCGLRFQSQSLRVFLKEATDDCRLPLFTQQGMLSMLSALKSAGYGSHPNVQILMEKAQDLVLVGQDRLSERELLNLVFGKRSSEAEEALCSRLLEQLMRPEKLQTLSDEALAKILPGMCQRGITNEAQLNCCTEEIVRRLQTATPEILSFYAYGFRVNRIHADCFIAPFAEEVVKEERLSNFTSQHLTGIFYSLARLGWKDVSTFQSLLRVIARPQNLDQCSEQGLVNIVAGIQLSRVPLNRDAARLLNETVQSPRLLHFSERSLLSLITSFKRMRLRSHQWTRPVFEEITKIGRLARLTNEELAELLFVLPGLKQKTAQGMDRLKTEVLKPHRLNKMDPDQLSRLVCGLGGLRMSEEDVWQSIQEYLSTIDVTSLTNNTLANFVYGLGEAVSPDKDLCAKILEEATQEGRMMDYTPSELTDIVVGMEKLQEADPPSAVCLTETLDDANRLTNLTDQRLILIFVSTAQIAASRDSSSFPDALLSVVADPGFMSRLHSHQLVQLCSVLKHNMFRQAPFLSLAVALSEEVQKSHRLTSMSLGDLTTLSVTFADAGFKKSPVVANIAQELMERFLRKTEDQRKYGET